MANKIADEISNKGYLNWAAHVRGLVKLGKSLEQERDQLQTKLASLSAGVEQQSVTKELVDVCERKVEFDS